MWRKFLVLSICSVSIITIFSLLYLKYGKANKETYLPEFKFIDINKKWLNSGSLQNYKGYCIVLFNTDCEICQAEEEIISRAKNIYKENCFILLSPEPDSIIDAFISKHKLKSDNVFILSAPLDVIMQTFDGKSAPFVFIYNKDKKLIYKANTSPLDVFMKCWDAGNKK